MKRIKVQKAYLVLMVILSVCFGGFPGDAAALVTAVDLGAAASFAGFGGGSGLTNQGIFTVINGDLGTTGTSALVTGFHDTGANAYTETPLNIGAVNGTIHTAMAPAGSAPGVLAAAAALAAQNAFNHLSPAALPGEGQGGGEGQGVKSPFDSCPQQSAV